MADEVNARLQAAYLRYEQLRPEQVTVRRTSVGVETNVDQFERETMLSEINEIRRQHGLPDATEAEYAAIRYQRGRRVFSATLISRSVRLARGLPQINSTGSPES